LVFELVFIFPQREVEAAGKHIWANNYGRLAVLAMLSLASIGVSVLFVWAALRSSWPFRLIYVALFFLFTAVEYATHIALGVFSGFNLAMTAVFVGDIRFVLHAITEYFALVSLVPTIAFVLLLVLVKPEGRNGIRSLTTVLIAAVVFFGASAYFTRNQYFTTSLSAAVRTTVGFPTLWYLGSIRGPATQIEYRSERREVTFRSNTAAANNIVFIIDESVRGDHLSINGYEVPTSEYLVGLAGQNLVKNWGIAVSGSTCSVESNNMLLTGVRPEPNIGSLISRLPTIFQFARAMNYRTYQFDGQTAGQWLGKPRDRDYIDNYISVNELRADGVTAQRDIDAEIARRVKTITASSVGNFVWVNKVGVHKPYAAALPGGDSPATWDAWGMPYNPAIEDKDLIAAYDKAITHNATSFFSTLIRDNAIDPSTIYIYTADHGQTLRENGSIVSHCSDTKPEANVPLFVIADLRSLPTVDTDYKSSHANIFPTLLDLMGVPESAREYSYAKSLLKASSADSVPRFYIAPTMDIEGKLLPFD
jgi:glucan phosphoethanolaminetransferase (alkaline phosphatase superfamily)